MAYQGNEMGMANPAMKYEMQDTSLQMPATVVNVETQRPNWSWCSTVWSSIAVWICCPLFGFIGLLCSVFSYMDHKSGDFDRSSRKRRRSWGWTIPALVFGILGWISIIVWYATGINLSWIYYYGR